MGRQAQAQTHCRGTQESSTDRHSTHSFIYADYRGRPTKHIVKLQNNRIESSKTSRYYFLVSQL